ncbi:MAG: hypothetical protein GYB68_07660 [Chloroflexi bacterium]|nr:hypothetical protein [Chloroflexota bacterium]
MLKVILRNNRHIPPFNEPASKLRVLNKPLWQLQREILEPFVETEVVVNSFDTIPSDVTEMLVYADNLWFDEAFIQTFVNEARRRKKPVRVAFRADDPAYLQQGLRQVTKSFEKRGDLYYADLWYFPLGPSDGVEPLIISSEAQAVPYYQLTSNVPSQDGKVVWWVPERSMCPIDSWLHLFFANTVFGVFTEAVHFDQRSGDTSFRFRMAWRNLSGRAHGGSPNEVTTGTNANIDPSTVFHGLVVIGDDVTIGPGCVISNCIIGDGVTLAHANSFSMSILGDGCYFPGGASASFTTFFDKSQAALGASLEMSIVGRNTYIGGGTVLTNVNLLPQRFVLNVDYEPHEVEVPVLGSCVGHNCRLGPGMIVYPGRMIESDVVLMASPTRRVIMNDISFEESDHHASELGNLHPRLYPRQDQQRADSW